jgi:hypothetical protein
VVINTASTYHYTSASNRLAALDTRPVAVDPNGNLTRLRALNLSYTPDDRLVTVTSGSRYGYSLYNGLGERAAHFRRLSNRW